MPSFDFRGGQVLRPFGEVSFEEEVDKLGKQYRDYFLYDAPFNRAAVDRDCYLIVGRRGSGKTTLANYFTFQEIIPGARCIDVDEPDIYADLIRRVANKISDLEDLAISHTVKVWEYLIWNLVFELLADKDSEIKNACRFLQAEKVGRPARVLHLLLGDLLAKLLGANSRTPVEVSEFLFTSQFQKAQRRAIELLPYSPAIVAIDSLEHYSVNDESLMIAAAALIESAKLLNRRYSHHGLHVKVFLPAEVYPHLQERFISNTLKYSISPLHLHWRPKELIKLLCFRFHQYMQRRADSTLKAEKEINWDRFSSVREAVWDPFFGRNIRNGGSINENSFAYVLRHTQLRPRQLIYLCNCIAERAMQEGSFPVLQPEIVTEVIRDKESTLATEVLNAYKSTFPNVAEIILALSGFNSVFKANELDKAAHRSASSWPQGDYSPLAFRRIVAELGIVGRVRHTTSAGFKMTDFEYAIEDRLALHEGEECAIHPMFYKKLNVSIHHQHLVYPFPEHFSEPLIAD